ncbi:hypothetical protein FA227_24955 [Pseudomonas aeruginosa]|nr:hypothetical protein F7O94_12600 [Pseudomonas aeruginosa]MCO3058755.1 hypothetical protein [Pseudomonas aeruginosa]MCO3131533.1 hypothetical protein [Pseudomonas aeruginosa]MCO3161877.1 hypothetical protein [Pseudomonas aeruginosa]
MSEARRQSPSPKRPRPMAGWTASLPDSGLLALAMPRAFAGMERDWGNLRRHPPAPGQELELAPGPAPSADRFHSPAG